MNLPRLIAWFTTGVLVCVVLPLLIAMGVKNGMTGDQFSGSDIFAILFLGVMTGLALVMLSQFRD